MSKYKLSDSDNEKVKQAIGRAEAKTSGEIVTAIIKESSDYAFYELLFSLIGGFVYYLVCLFLYNDISRWLNNFFWTYSEVYTTAFIGMSTIFVIGLFYVLANIDGVDRLIVPAKVIGKKVNRRALLFFGESGLFDTKDRTGVLIFISLKEKRVELIADKGINELVKQDTWNDVVSNLITRLKERNIVDGLVEAVDSCGNILSENFPIQPDDENELSDDVHILED
ncbi:MAG: TPM domain-containing protein [Spirochaetaceae bacterium]|jgi:putative membrane protein|nr:TPM domain-containing protein [Spirochaetaceae bacterium]